MKTQISRDTFSPDRRYSGVYQQQGRVITDADWNELMDVVKTGIDQVIRDAIAGGAPRDRGLKVLNGFKLQPGHLYVDGIHAELPGDAALDFNDQPDFSEARALPVSGGGAPSGYRLYADVWQRPVLALEDGFLLDPGLHGADTCVRTRTMLQVKWCPSGVDPGNPATNPPIGNAPLTLALWRATAGADPCDPCASEVDLDARVGNYLFRVEVHEWKLAGDGSGELTLKWSSENGAEQHKVDRLGLGFDQGDWIYEFFNLACEENAGVHLATDFVPSRSQLVSSYPSVVPADRPWVRRWDGYCVLARSSGGVWSLKAGMDKGVTLSTGLGVEAHGHAAIGAGLELNLTSMALTLGLGDNVYVAGDYWLAAVREAVHKPGDTLLDAATPGGLRHHYLWLADCDAAGHVQAFSDDKTRRRCEFPPLSDMWARDVGYENEICSESAAENVQQALDWLCRQRDLRHHNKHLHGWGIVCGLQVECGPDTVPEENEEDGKRREVMVQKGYAIDCEGNDIVLDVPDIRDLMSMVEAHDAAAPSSPILKDGDGAVSLTIARGADGSHDLVVEKYDPKKENGLQTLLDGTLFIEFYQQCIVDLVDAVKDELTADPEEQKALVGPTTRRWIALLNLVIQIFNHDNGRYVFLSLKEHEILEKFYERLQQLLRSKTFCAMFEDDEFPKYPFPETKISTIFARDWHTRLRLTPDGMRAYTCGAANQSIHLFDLKKEEMIQSIDMPVGEGAKVVDVAVHPKGAQLVAIASLASGDTVVGVADIAAGGAHTWRPMRVMCGLQMSCLMFSDDGKQLWMIGKNAGLFAFQLETLLTDTERPLPKYAFNACGHASYDLSSDRAAATASTGSTMTGRYNRVVGMDLNAAGDNLTPQYVRTLVRPDTGAAISGDDGLLLIGKKDSGHGARLCVVTNPRDAKDENKHLLVFDASGNASPNSSPMFDLPVENTCVCMAWHTPAHRLLVGLEDGYRLQVFELDKGQSTTFRHPVQISPVAIAGNAATDRVYVFNCVSNTITVIPGAELETGQEFLDKLEEYRTAAIAAFWGLAGNLLQYLKDCFCHHLLVKCPECDADDKIYLASIDVRDNKIYKICNFAKRKYVKSFPTIAHWLSLIPVMPFAKKALEMFCCRVFPDLFSGLYAKYAIGTAGSFAYAKAGNNIKSTQLRKGIQMWQGADVKTMWAAEKKDFNVYGLLARDAVLNRVEASAITQPGLYRSQVLAAPVDEARERLRSQGVRVESVKTYDRMQDAGKFAAYRQAPVHLPPGARVTLYEQDGKVLFYTLAEEKVAVEGVSPEVRTEIDDLERRKAALDDLSEINADYARAEARKAELANLAASREELAALEQQKARVQQDVGALKAELAGLQAQRAALADVGALAGQIEAARGQLDGLRQAREAEATAVAALETRRTELTAAIGSMNADIETLIARQKELSASVEKDRPVRDVAGVDAETDKRLSDIGVRTVGDLAGADPRLLARANIDEALANSLIASARTRLKK
jgi:hypothetical protein